MLPVPNKLFILYRSFSLFPRKWGDNKIVRTHISVIRTGPDIISILNSEYTLKEYYGDLIFEVIWNLSITLVFDENFQHLFVLNPFVLYSRFLDGVYNSLYMGNTYSLCVIVTSPSTRIVSNPLTINTHTTPSFSNTNFVLIPS